MGQHNADRLVLSLISYTLLKGQNGEVVDAGVLA